MDFLSMISTGQLFSSSAVADKDFPQLAEGETKDFREIVEEILLKQLEGSENASLESGFLSMPLFLILIGNLEAFIQNIEGVSALEKDSMLEEVVSRILDFINLHQTENLAGFLEALVDAETKQDITALLEESSPVPSESADGLSGVNLRTLMEKNDEFAKEVIRIFENFLGKTGSLTSENNSEASGENPATPHIEADIKDIAQVKANIKDIVLKLANGDKLGDTKLDPAGIKAILSGGEENDTSGILDKALFPAILESLNSDTGTKAIFEDLNSVQIEDKFQFIDLVKDIVSRMQVQERTGSWQTFLELNPAHLGKTNVLLELTGTDRLLLNFIVSQSDAKDAINSYISDLQDILEEKGITLESCEVDVNPDFNFGRAPLWHQLLSQELNSKAYSSLFPFATAGSSDSTDYRDAFVLNRDRVNCIA